MLAAAATSLLPRGLFAQTGGGGASLGSGDVAVLNYAYALEQLEAAFYTRVTSSFYAGANATERSYLSDIHQHEVAHRSFLKGALGGSALPDLELDFSSVNFRDRQSVLTTASLLEDTGVAAYNGAGPMLRDPQNLMSAGRIVSVEARHAATLRDLLHPRSTAFAGDDQVDAFGLGSIMKPSAVLKTAGTFIRTPIDFSGLPKA